MHNLKRSLLILFVLAFLIPTRVFAKSTPFPETIPLPDGFRPEGIVSGYGTQFYAGSLANGAIFMGDFRSGDGGILVEGTPGNIAVGLAFDERNGYPVRCRQAQPARLRFTMPATANRLATYNLASAGSFINDVILTPTAAFFTDSFNARLFKLPLSADGGLPGRIAGGDSSIERRLDTGKRL